MKVIRIITSVKVSDHNFMIGQEYEHSGTTKRITGCHHCDDNKYVSGRGYVTMIDGRSVVIPAENCAIINKESVSENKKSLWQQIRKQATRDFVVTDGDFTKAAEDLLGIDLKPKERPDQADYNMRRIREALRFNSALLDGYEQEDPEPGPVSTSIIGELIIGVGEIKRHHEPVIGQFIIGYDKIQNS